MKLLIDVHAHLDHEAFAKDIDKVVLRAKEAGIAKIIANGVNSETNRLCLEYASKYDIIEAALGWYPQDALEREVSEGEYPISEQKLSIDEEIDFIRKQEFVALGEVGLDFKGEPDKERQKKDFQKIIDLALELDKPLIVHSRKAELDVIEMLEASKVKKVVMHCFSGKFKLVERIAKNGWSFSVPVNLVKSEQFQKLVKFVDISQILTETDAPYLGPVSGERNEPANIVASVKKIAEIKGMVPEEVENVLFMNYQKMFM